MIEEEIFEYLNNADLFDLQELAVDRLPPRTQKLVTNLHGHFGGNVIEDIINTNAFAVELFDGDDETTYNIVLPEISVRLSPPPFQTELIQQSGSTTTADQTPTTTSTAKLSPTTSTPSAPFSPAKN
jgi:hypothetical protein